MSDLKTTLLARLEAIAAADKITKAELLAFSRESFEYLADTHDVDMINRLIGVLTPANKAFAIEFYTHFIPWKVERDNNGKFVRFGKMMDGQRRVDEKWAMMKEFLADENNNIWTWTGENVEVSKKDFVGTITKAVKAALKGHEKSDTDPLTHDQVMDAVIAGGITMDDLIEAATKRVKEAEAAAQEVNQKVVSFAEETVKAAA